MFWKRKEGGETKLPGPKEIPELIGMYLVVHEKKDPDRVWKFKGVVRQVGNKEFFCRVFDDIQVANVNVKVRDWTSLDAHPELVLWEGYFNKRTNVVRPGKFAELPNSG